MPRKVRIERPSGPPYIVFQNLLSMKGPIAMFDTPKAEPDMPQRTETTGGGTRDAALDLARRACAYLDGQEGRPVTLAELGRALDASPWHLQRVFKRVIGVTPREYADARRLAQFRRELQDGGSVAGATYGAGFGSSSRIYERAGHALGMTPASYARGGKGAVIAYATAPSPLGRLLVAATAKGICFVALGEDDAALEQALRAEFPNADALNRDDDAIRPALVALLDYLAGTLPHPDLPLDVQATAFQRRVWSELAAIPPGETRSYGEIAEAIGAPGAQRAVGRACATNPVPLVVPCHRVLRSDGALGGYRWGLGRKRALIEAEEQRRARAR
jgi:AraC family transcriptional regulator of adaptative response/methylated-DNA-[protein]-cysteine methyltransferase